MAGDYEKYILAPDEDIFNVSHKYKARNNPFILSARILCCVGGVTYHKPLANSPLWLQPAIAI
jgi:hypothetical protein